MYRLSVTEAWRHEVPFTNWLSDHGTHPMDLDRSLHALRFKWMQLSAVKLRVPKRGKGFMWLECQPENGSAKSCFLLRDIIRLCVCVWFVFFCFFFFGGGGVTLTCIVVLSYCRNSTCYLFFITWYDKNWVFDMRFIVVSAVFYISNAGH